MTTEETCDLPQAPRRLQRNTIATAIVLSAPIARTNDADLLVMAVILPPDSAFNPQVVRELTGNHYLADILQLVTVLTFRVTPVMSR